MEPTLTNNDVENGTATANEETPLKAVAADATNEPSSSESKNMVIGYALLFMTVIGLSSLAPTYDSIHNVNERIKLFWRLSGGAIFLAPLALLKTQQLRRAKLQKEKDGNGNTAADSEEEEPLTAKDWFWAGFGIVCFTGCLLLFVSSLRFTSVANAVILMNCQALSLLVYRLVVLRKPIGFVETGGAVVASLGVVCCVKDPRIAHAAIHPQTIPNSYNIHPVLLGYIGDAMALCAAIGGGIFIITTRTVRSRVDGIIFTFWNTFSGSCLVLLFLLVSGQEFTWGNDPNNGLFGWMTAQTNRLLPEFVLVFVCTFCGTLGFYYTMGYFDNLVMATSSLAQPVVAIFLAYFVGVGNLPGWLGWLGNVMVAAGMYAVIFTSDQRKRQGID